MQTEVKAGTVITLPAPARDGYTFNYWEGSHYAAGESYTVTEDHTFTAQWIKNSASASTTPDTSDGSHTGLWFTLMMISLISAAGAAVFRMKFGTDR